MLRAVFKQSLRARPASSPLSSRQLLDSTRFAPVSRIRHYSAAHEEESFDSFSTRYVSFFDGVEDLFELQRGLNNCFAYDLVPSVGVVEAAVKAARRVNDYATAVRVFEGIKQKVENKGQYAQYLEETKSLREQLGITLKEEMK